MAASQAELDLCRSQPFPVAVTAGLLSPAFIAVPDSSWESARVHDRGITRPQPKSWIVVHFGASLRNAIERGDIVISRLPRLGSRVRILARSNKISQI